MATKKVTLNMLESQVEFLQKQAIKEDLTFTDLVRRAVALEKFIIEAEEKGHKLLIEVSPGKMREIIRK